MLKEALSSLENRSANVAGTVTRLNEAQVLCTSLCEVQREKVSDVSAQMRQLQVRSDEISSNTAKLGLIQSEFSSQAVSQLQDANTNGEAILLQLEESTQQLDAVTTENVHLHKELDAKTAECSLRIAAAATQCEQYQAALLALRADAASLEQELHKAREHASIKV